MGKKAEYRCLECGDTFDWKAHCVLHAMEWKHSTFEMLSTDIKIVIKV